MTYFCFMFKQNKTYQQKKKVMDVEVEGKARVGRQSLGSASRGSMRALLTCSLQLSAHCVCVCVCVHAKRRGDGMWVARK